MCIWAVLLICRNTREDEPAACACVGAGDNSQPAFASFFSASAPRLNSPVDSELVYKQLPGFFFPLMLQKRIVSDR